MAEVGAKRAGRDAGDVRSEWTERTSLDERIAHQNVTTAIAGHDGVPILHIRTERSTSIAALIRDRNRCRSPSAFKIETGIECAAVAAKPSTIETRVVFMVSPLTAFQLHPGARPNFI